jgi:hypothetical protein
MRDGLQYPRAEVGAGRCIQLMAAWREVVLVPTYNGGKGQRGVESLVPVPMHVHQPTRRIELSLKKARS